MCKRVVCMSLRTWSLMKHCSCFLPFTLLLALWYTSNILLLSGNNDVTNLANTSTVSSLPVFFCLCRFSRTPVRCMALVLSPKTFLHQPPHVRHLALKHLRSLILQTRTQLRAVCLPHIRRPYRASLMSRWHHHVGHQHRLWEWFRHRLTPTIRPLRPNVSWDQHITWPGRIRLDAATGILYGSICYSDFLLCCFRCT
jgi:hypothetical protein